MDSLLPFNETVKTLNQSVSYVLEEFLFFFRSKFYCESYIISVRDRHSGVITETCNKKMGQSTSTETNNLQNDITNTFSTKKSILLHYNNKAVKQFTRLELLSFRDRIGKMSLLEPLSDENIINWLNIPKDNEHIIITTLKMIRVYSNFPFINSPLKEITGIGLLKTILLLDRDKFTKFVGEGNYSYLTLLFISLATEITPHILSKSSKNVPSDNEDPENNVVNFKEIIQNYDNIQLEKLSISSDSLLAFLQWMLIIWQLVPNDNSIIDATEISQDMVKHKLVCLNILRTMQYKNSNNITHTQFVNTISIYLPNLWKPISTLFKHLLYKTSELEDSPSPRISFQETDLMTKDLLSLLSLMIAQNHLVINNIQKLYVGGEYGFSMRSFQSKVFKWLAPTILLISGMRISDDIEYAKQKNPRYNKFLEEYTTLKADEQSIDRSLLKKRKVIFAVIIKEPWKVTNKDQFGGEGTTIYQLSPWIDVYKATKPNIVYFNTNGGGIGIGNAQPIIKPTYKKYVPGNVSLTLDNSLEFGVFRHIGYGGVINPGLLNCIDEAHSTHTNIFEIRFLIKQVEVWGCGGEKELAEQIKRLEWEEAEAKRRQQINLKSLGEDRALLEMAGLVGQHRSGGSM